jgi:hypothetical protein
MTHRFRSATPLAYISVLMSTAPGCSGSEGLPTAANPPPREASGSESGQASEVAEAATFSVDDAGVLIADGCALLDGEAGPPATCSGRGDAPALLIVQNGCALPLDAWSVTPPLTCPDCCAESFVATLPQGQSSTLSSVASHAWRLRLPDAGPVVVDIPPLGSGTTMVVVR